PNLEYLAVAGSPVFHAAPRDLDKKYKRHDFQALYIGQVNPRLASYLSAVFPGSSSSYMLARRQRHDDGYWIYTFMQVPEVERMTQDTYELVALLYIAGAALILLVWGFRNYLH